VNETVQDVPEDAPVTYQIVVGGSTRGNMKLVSSDGYTFVKKRTLVNGTVDWRCSVRGRKSGCPAVVKQTGSDYRVAGSAHTHESKPGILTAVKVKTEVSTLLYVSRIQRIIIICFYYNKHQSKMTYTNKITLDKKYWT
jgi:hypothetical protein